ncbi:MAG: TolB family protein, partial [Bacteroidota bacterium]
GLASPRGGNIFSDLYLLDLKTGRTRRLTKSLRASDPSWSPDGRRIAFIRNAPPNYHLYVMPADGGRPEPLWRAEGLAQAYTPAWSPRGDRIAFARFKPGDGQRILLIRPDGAEEAPLHAGPPLGEEMDPAWSPDGRYVFFAADPAGVFNIYACDAENGSLWQVTNVLTGAYAPAVSPDGRTLAYTGYSPAGYDQYTLPLDPAAWRPYVPGPRMTEEGEKPAGLPTSYFHSAEAATDAPAEPYSPWRTLAPGFGLASVSIDASGDYELELYLDGSDILETTHYAVLLGGSSLGFDCRAQVDLRLRSLTLTLLGGQENEDHAFGVDPAGFILNRLYYQVFLEGGAAGLLSPGDGFSWAATAYLVREREIHADYQTAPESLVGAEAAAQYGRTAVYGGPVDLAEGFVLGYRIGAEERLGSGSRVNWQSAWGSIFLPVADQCRLELTGAVKENSAGAATVDFGMEGLALLQGSLVGEARTELEYPLIVAERGGEVSPWYLHGVNGLAILAAGQSLDPAARTMYGAGLGLKFRLQMGYLMPLDLSVLYLRTDDYDSYWTLGMEMPY